MSDIRKEICEIAKAVGEIVRNADREKLSIKTKDTQVDFVTKYDVQVQETLKEKLLGIVPDAVFVGEENSDEKYTDKGKVFIVDPIDGTTNFIKDYHASGISIALLEDGKVIVGVIYNPYLDEMYSAKLGEGAFCNEKPIHVSKEPLENGIVLFGSTPYHKDLADKSFNMAKSYFMKALDVRRSGSAALDLCSIAAGRAELYFELLLSPWDYAAGSLIVTEAGGIVTNVDGGALTFDKPSSLLATNNVK